VTWGPGATNASHGVHIATQDSTPMILFVGQVGRGMREREAFQELDKAVFGSIAKWVVEIDSAIRIPELITRAFRVAMQGRPGPVVIALPEDVLTEIATIGDIARVEAVEVAPRVSDMDKLVAREAKRPLGIVGGSRCTERARAQFVVFAERAGLPVAASFRRASG
jgi:acetolactate synthase I/II/III large subunit